MISRLGGAVREMARVITPQQMMHGGMLGGVQVFVVGHDSVKKYCSRLLRTQKNAYFVKEMPTGLHRGPR